MPDKDISLSTKVVKSKGEWNASTNTPTLADGTGVQGDSYRVSVAGTQDLGSGSNDYKVGDYVYYDGSVYHHDETAPLTGPRVKALYEAESDTNVFNNSRLTKLDGIEELADVSQSRSRCAAVA